MFKPGDMVEVKATSQVFEVVRAEKSNWSGSILVCVLDDGRRKWYYEGEVKPA